MLKRSVHASVLLSNCKQSITSLSLLVGTTVTLLVNLIIVLNQTRTLCTQFFQHFKLIDQDPHCFHPKNFHCNTQRMFGYSSVSVPLRQFKVMVTPKGYHVNLII